MTMVKDLMLHSYLQGFSVSSNGFSIPCNKNFFV